MTDNVKPKIEEQERPPHPSAFVRWLEAQGECGLLDDEMTELVRTVKEINKPGSMTVTVSFRPGQDGRIKAVLKCVKKMPQYDREEKNFFTDEKGQLLRQNPKQRNLQMVPPQPPAAG